MLAGAGAIQWGDFATWIASIGTIGALFAALWQIDRERKRQIQEGAKVRELEARDRDERHHAHARLISAWKGSAEPLEAGAETKDLYKFRTPMYMQNSSREPVYGIIMGIVFIQGAAPQTIEGMLRMKDGQQASLFRITTVSVLPPGTWRVWLTGYHNHSYMATRNGVEVAFTDRAGANWVRRGQGELEELSKRPFEYYLEFGLHPPYELHAPEPVT